MLPGIGNEKVLLKMKVLTEPKNYADHNTSSDFLSLEIIYCDSAHKLFISSSQFMYYVTEILKSKYIIF